ncbi:MAG: sugar transferase [Candidatus Binatia bacterium]
MTSLQKHLKRAFDLGFTLVATIVLLPVGFVVALLIRLGSPGPVLYRSVRVGKNGRHFTLYKFRTMVSDAEALGPSLTHKDDPRITRMGRVLRKTKFDEFPQVINVLNGDMSIVGPRPESAAYVSTYSPEQRKVLRMKPGLTSLAQVVYRDEEALLTDQDIETFYVNEVLPRKLALDLYYVQHWSLALDFKVFLLGLLALLSIPPPAVLWPFKDGTAPSRTEA